MPTCIRTSDRPTKPRTMPDSAAGTKGSDDGARRSVCPARYIPSVVPSARSTSLARPLAATHSRLAGTAPTRRPESLNQLRTAATSEDVGENRALNALALR